MVNNIAVIGVGAAGATAALQARKFNRKVAITIFNTEPYSQYSRCGLPYTISGKVREFDDLVLMPPSNWDSVKINAKLNTTVTEIDHKNHTLKYNGAEEGELKYDALIFATGARNADPPIKGLDKERDRAGNAGGWAMPEDNHRPHQGELSGPRLHSRGR